MKEQKLACAIASGHIPHKSSLGYKRNGKMLVPYLYTKDVIVRIFNLYYEGNSYQTIANIFKKEEGRNVDINVANMNEYEKFKREQGKYKRQLKELNNKADELQNKSNEINNIIDNFKPTITNKNNFIISNENVDKIKSYIEQTNNTTSNLRDSNDINIVLQKHEDDLREHSNEARNLKKKIKTRDDKIEELEYDLNDVNDTIYELEDKVSKLEETLNYFKELWNKFIKFLQDKLFSSNKYDNFINDLYDENIIDDNEIDII